MQGHHGMSLPLLGLARTKQQVYGQLVEALVLQAFGADGGAIESPALESFGFFGAVFAKIGL
jgi:hypothetical protein